MKSKNYKLKIKQEYRPSEIESKWRKIWEERTLYQPDIKRSKKPFYNLMMFPYPSALGLHVGNIYAFVGSDIYGRLKRMQGFDVFEPIGLDGFGIHSENFALKVGKHPMDLSKKTESSIYAQLHAIGNGFAWSNKLETYISDYYKWTQWIFIQLFKKGLAYRAKASVNWCPSCLTVLADEQVVNKSQESRVKSQKNNQLDSRIWRLETIFVCERCGTEVEKRELEQWFFRITNYAQRLLSGLEKIDWSEKVKIAQRNWLGKSEGLLLEFESDIESNVLVEVFTTRPDTLYGVTFMALAPEHPQVTKILDKSKGLLKRQIQKYVADSLKKVQEVRKVSEVRKEETGEEPVKIGIKTPFHCTNPATGKKIPIFIADYVVMSYGTGAVMGVPAHDQRDYDFAKKYQIDIVEVIRLSGYQVIRLSGKIKPDNLNLLSQQAFTGEGVLVNSGEFNGLKSQEAIGAITNFAVKKGFGKKKIMWHLRDWLISRQRYWGAPIPIIYCSRCRDEQLTINNKQSFSANKQLTEGIDYAVIDGVEYAIYPVPEEDLPVELPYIENFKPTGTGVSPLAQDPNFVKVKCPECGSEARRETDVSDTFLDSAWYFLRYPSVSEVNSKSQTLNSKQIINSKISNSKKGLGFSASNLGFPWNREITRKWLPVDMYIGGAEHSVLHLLYSRFLWKAFYDFGYFSAKSPKGQLGGPGSFTKGGSATGRDWEEPFSKFRAHGLLISEGAKMSKSKGNVVLPDPYIAKYGADTLRTYLMFCGRFDQGGDFRDTGIEGMSKFLKRIWRMVSAWSSGLQVIRTSGRKNPDNPKTRQPDNLHMMHKTIKKVSEDIENLRYNTAISAIMGWVNFLEEKVQLSVIGSRLSDSSQSVSQLTGQQKTDRPISENRQQKTDNFFVAREEIENLLLLLAPFAPHMAEELWDRLSGYQDIRTSGKSKPENPKARKPENLWSIHTHPWPKYDEKLATSAKIELVVEVNGKVRDKITADRDIEEEEAQKLALAQKNTQKYLSGKTPKKVIFVKGRLINFVV